MRSPFEIPPGINTDDTDFAKVGWSAGSMVRFVNGKPQSRRGWETMIGTALTGVCRWVYTYTAIGELVAVFGTHTDLQVAYGGGLYTITPSGLAAGNIDGTGGAGYGTGTYSSGDYSEPSTADYWPRTWSGGNWGVQMIASPRGGTIYAWDGDTNSLAAAITDAPAEVTYCLVAANQRQVMAFGCNEFTSEDFNPMCIRTSGAQDYDNWDITDTTQLAREYILSGSGRIVAARFIGDYCAVWTNGGLYLGTYVGDATQVWRFDPVAQNCGLIGPNAVVVKGQTAYWLTPSGQFMAYTLGAAPVAIPSGVRNWLFDNLASAQQDKIVAASVSAYDEVEWFYPDARDGNENSRSVSLNVSGEFPIWATHELARTAFVDADPASYPIGVTYAGQVLWHEKGYTADGGALTGYLESADQYLNDAQDRLLIRGMWPDFKDQQGAVSLSIITRDEAQGSETTRGPYALSPSTTRKDFFVEARLARLRLDFSATPSAWRLGTPTFDVVKTGQW